MIFKQCASFGVSTRVTPRCLNSTLGHGVIEVRAAWTLTSHCKPVWRDAGSLFSLLLWAGQSLVALEVPEDVAVSGAQAEWQ